MHGRTRVERDPRRNGVSPSSFLHERLMQSCIAVMFAVGCGSSAPSGTSAQGAAGSSGDTAVGAGTAGRSGSVIGGTASAEGGTKSLGGSSSVAGGSDMGGKTSLGGTTATGGSLGNGGTALNGGTTAVGGGTPNIAGTTAKGGAAATGGLPGTGGRSNTGGSTPTGGTSNSGGNDGKAGTSTTGGTSAMAGAAPTGGTMAAGGTLATGGTAATDTGPAPCGKATLTLGSSTPSQDASMQRARVSGKDCKQYVVQNNNFGDPTGSTQIINVTGNSFTIESSSALSASGNIVAPASFPSIYIGGNGDIANGAFLTWADSGLPKQISSISRVPTTLTWSGGKSDGDYGATCEAWLSKSVPVAGSYADAISGSLVVWLHRPANRDPIGIVTRQAVVAAHAWDVWVGPHGHTNTGTDDLNRPVVSYVLSDESLSTLSFDLKDFITDAVANAGADKSNGKTSQSFAASWYLTDVFGGFEIWSGVDAATLKQTFTCVVD
jgi:hypothetical protein